MINSLIPFTIADKHIPEWATGEIVRYGTILKNKNTGRIVGHLQETGMWKDVLSGGANLLGGTNPVGGVTSIFTVAQGEQIKSSLASIETTLGGMHTLQIATLATSVVGIGVTMASTAIILNRIKQLDSALTRIEEKVDGLPAKLREIRLRETLVDLQTDLERVDESTHRSDRQAVLQKVEEQLNYGFNRFADGAQQVVTEMVIDAQLLQVLMAALSVCGGAQFKALLSLDEKKGAMLRATRQNRRIEELTWEMAQDILESRLRGPTDQAKLIAKDASELRMRLAARPLLLETLISGGIHGRDYIEQAEHEREEPLLLLPAVHRAGD